MVRRSRTFKLRLSPAGMDLLIDSHCHLIRSTRSLLAWGTTLHVAVGCLDKLPADMLLNRIACVEEAGLSGAEEHHLGASKALGDLANRIAQRVFSLAPERGQPTLAYIYLVALRQLTLTDPETLKAAYETTKMATEESS